MPQRKEKYDYLVIGGGLFGVYAALYLEKKGNKVALIEKEDRLFRKASLVNQARLHGGYHYPRSIATAMMSDENKQRFTEEHQDFIFSEFPKYYGIDAYSSFTDARQFERFCTYLKIPCQRIKQHDQISLNRLEALYLTREHTFDPVLISAFYTQKIQAAKGINVFFNAEIKATEKGSGHWFVQAQTAGVSMEIEASGVVNATYAATNSVNHLFDIQSLDLQHEISEMVFLHAPALEALGLTIMDGQFSSIMPYGKTGMLSLSSVAYTHHKVSYEDFPSFSCQAKNRNCRPNFLADCNTCFAKPDSNKRKMLSQIQLYFQDEVVFHYFCSLFTIKSKLLANYIDDGRPTEISKLNDNPPYYCLFAGKINSIYEIEKIIS